MDTVPQWGQEIPVLFWSENGNTLKLLKVYEVVELASPITVSKAGENKDAYSLSESRVVFIRKKKNSLYEKMFRGPKNNQAAEQYLRKM